MYTREELKDYIAGFHKRPGDYTPEEILTIGSEMRKLPNSEKDWKWLHEYLGITDFSAEALRKRVQRYHADCAIISEDEESKTFREAYANQYKERQWVTAYRRMIRDEVRIDTLKDEIQQAVSKVNALPRVQPLPPYQISDSGDREGVLLFSDLHIGVDCDNYYNKYNADIARKRLHELLTKVEYYARIHRLTKLNFVNLGDLIHGVIHTNARLEQQMDVMEQVMAASEMVADFLNELTALPLEVTYRSAFDNHSRVIADKNEHIEKEQLSRLIDWYLEERLKNTKVKFMNDNIDGGIGRFEIFGKTLMFAHGHQDSKERSVQTFVGLTRQWVDYICLGHYHHPEAGDYHGIKVFVNGSIVGTEQYAFGRRLFSKPSQKLLVFAEDSDDVIDIDILL